MKFLKIGIMTLIIGILCGCSIKTTGRVDIKNTTSPTEFYTSTTSIVDLVASTGINSTNSSNSSTNTSTTVVIETFLGSKEEIETTTEYLIVIRPANAETHTEAIMTSSVEEVKENVETNTYTTTSTYIVYKPSTHYIHKSNCQWIDLSCYKIENTNDLECRKCSECNPELEIINEYIAPAPEFVSNSITYVKNFSRGTYYAYGGARNGGSGRSLIDCSCGDDTVKGSVASSYLYNNYGYNYNGKRTMLYLEISDYPSMNGYYYLDDSDAGNPNVIDFFYLYNSNCQFENQGVISVDCYIVNY